MSWASHPTNEMPESLAPTGRHRRRRPSIIGIGIAGGLLVLAVTGATLGPALLGGPPESGFSAVEDPLGSPSAATNVSTEESLEAAVTGESAYLPGDDTPPVSSETPKVTPARSATAITADLEVDAFAERVLTRTNDERAANGCPALRLDGRLAAAARDHTAEMAFRQQLTHTGTNGTDPGARMRAAGYNLGGGWAENVAAGYPTPEAVMTGWMKSKDHRANILNCSLKAIGVGVARAANGQLYWTQDFGGR